MWNNLLAVSSELADEYPKYVGIGEAAIDALLGFIVVFIGIAFLVFVVWLVGYIMRKTSGKQPIKKKEKVEKEVIEDKETTSPVPVSETFEEIPEETVAAITAALMAYYAKEKTKCEFTGKRIKRI